MADYDATNREPSVRFTTPAHTDPVTEVATSLEKSWKPVQWVVGLLVAVFLGGVGFSHWESNKVTRNELEDVRQESADAHRALNRRIDKQSDRIDTVLKLQVLAKQQQDELNYKLDLLLQQTAGRGRDAVPAVRAARGADKVFHRIAQDALGADYEVLLQLDGDE